MADVEQNAALFGLEGGRKQLAVLDDVGELAVVVRRARVAVRENVAGPQRLQDQRHQIHRLHAADVAHHAAIGAREFAGADRALERLDAVTRNHVLRHADLDADSEVGVFREGLRRSFGLGEVDVEKLADRKRRQTNIGDVHEGEDSRARLRCRVSPVGREGASARVARGHCGGGALVKHQLVGRDADATGEDVRVQVDEARHDKASRGIHDPIGTRCGNVGLERLDPPVAHADIPFAAQPLAGVENFTTLDDEVELVVRAHRGVGDRAEGSGCESCAHAGYELSALERNHGFPPRGGMLTGKSTVEDRCRASSYASLETAGRIGGCKLCTVSGQSYHLER